MRDIRVTYNNEYKKDDSNSFNKLHLKKGGRKKIVSREQYLNAVKELGTDSPSILAKYLNVSRMTLWRVRKNDVSGIEVNQIISMISNLELKPYQMNASFFREISIIKHYINLLTINEVAEITIKNRVSCLLRICKYLDKHPKNLKPEDCSNLLFQIKDMSKKDRPYGISPSTLRKTTRSFFTVEHGISGEKLSSIGLHGKPTEGTGLKAHQRLTRKQRHDFHSALKKVLDRRFEKKDKILKISYLLLPKFLFYTGTRISATLNARIEDIIKKDDVWLIRIVDKGRRGGIIWYKIILGELKHEIEKLLELKDNPSDGYLFSGIQKHEKVRSVFNEAYEMIGLKVGGKDGIDPTHIWRHTFAQDMLEANNYNYEIVASIGGWKSTLVLKNHYGEIGDNQRVSARAREDI